jgi:hypothetical protein
VSKTKKQTKTAHARAHEPTKRYCAACIRELDAQGVPLDVDGECGYCGDPQADELHEVIWEPAATDVAAFALIRAAVKLEALAPSDLRDPALALAMVKHGERLLKATRRGDRG